MKKRHYTCENCGAELVIDANAESGKCEYCGSVYYIDKQKPAEVHHYFGNIRITPLRVVLAVALAAVLAAAIVILSLYFSGVFDDKKPPVSEKFEHEKAYLFEGTYLVGADMDAGEFVAFKAPSAERGEILVLTDKNASAGTSAEVARYVFKDNEYFSVETGVYVKVKDCNVFRVGDKKVEAKQDGSFEGVSVLRGGTDIPAGNYVICNDDAKTGQYTDVKFVIGGKEYKKRLGFRTHLNVGNGDYVYLVYGKLYAEQSAPMPVSDESGEYKCGQYKAGLDIPVGTYCILGNGYFVHNVSGSAFFDKSELIDPSTMSRVIDLEEGDYIYIDQLLRLAKKDEA